MDNLWNFAFLYLAQVVDCFFVITTVIAFDGMLLSFAMQISVEIKYMILKIRTLGSPNTKNPGNNSTRDLEILINICDDYNYLKRFTLLTFSPFEYSFLIPAVSVL